MYEALEFATVQDLGWIYHWSEPADHTCHGTKALNLGRPKDNESGLMLGLAGYTFTGECVSSGRPQKHGVISLTAIAHQVALNY